MLYLNEEFGQAWGDKDPYSIVRSQSGKIYRQVKSRRTLQFMLNGNSYFLKYHGGVGWLEIFKNLLQFRLPIVSAANEWQAIQRLKQLRIDTMLPVAYGKRGISPASFESFIVTQDLVETVSLEEFCNNWQHNAPSFRSKQILIEKVANIARQMHTHGICHRDFYLCHFLLRPAQLETCTLVDLNLYLIDLHRALVRNHLTSRWIEKDVAGLYFSSMDLGLTMRDLLRFMRTYRNLPIRQILKQDTRFWKRVKTKAENLYRKIHGVN